MLQHPTVSPLFSPVELAESSLWDYAHPSHTIREWVPLFSLLQRDREHERWVKSAHISHIETDSTWFKSWSFWFGQRIKKVKEKMKFEEESRSKSNELSASQCHHGAYKMTVVNGRKKQKGILWRAPLTPQTQKNIQSWMLPIWIYFSRRKVKVHQEARITDTEASEGATATSVFPKEGEELTKRNSVMSDSEDRKFYLEHCKWILGFKKYLQPLKM